MTQEEKQLLLIDLCSRLPYGVIVRHADPLIDKYGNETGEFWYKKGYLCDITTLDDKTTTIIESEGSDEEGYKHICLLERTIPYLRPMSSMTQEEKGEYQAFFNYNGVEYPEEYVNWLDSKMFAHRDIKGKDMFELGLAIKAPEGMYN